MYVLHLQRFDYFLELVSPTDQLASTMQVSAFVPLSLFVQRVVWSFNAGLPWNL